jgi:hypothetical protein
VNIMTVFCIRKAPIHHDMITTLFLEDIRNDYKQICITARFLGTRKLQYIFVYNGDVIDIANGNVSLCMTYAFARYSHQL